MEIKKAFSPYKGDLAALDKHFWNYVSSKIPNMPPESEDKKFLFSAFEKLEFVGGVSGNVYRGELEIDKFRVREDYRRRGLGKSCYSRQKNTPEIMMQWFRFCEQSMREDFMKDSATGYMDSLGTGQLAQFCIT